MASINHTHTYIKYKKRRGYFRCLDPHCTHIADKDFLVGKASLCTMCGAEFVLTTEDLKRAKPRCLRCSNTKAGEVFRNAEKAVMARFAGAANLLEQPPQRIKDFDENDDDPYEEKS